MKRGVPLAVLAIFFYACQNVVLDRQLVGEGVANRLPQLPAIVYVSTTFTTIALTALLVQWLRGVSVTAPTGSQMGWIVLAASLLFFADLAYFTAYASGTSVNAITTAAVLLPVFATFVNVATGGRWPTWYELAAIPFAAIAVFLVSRGQPP